LTGEDRIAIVLPRYDPPVSWEHGAPFWSAVSERRLVLPRCSVCHRWQWYPDDAGVDCADGAIEWVETATTGVVYTLTRVHRSFLPKGRADVPYLVGLVDLDGVAGCRLVANLADEPGMAIGARVAMRIESIGDRSHPVFELAP